MEDTIPGLHTRMPLTITKIYQEQFKFETINQQACQYEHVQALYFLRLLWIDDAMDCKRL